MVIGIDASRANAPTKTGTEWYSWHLIRELAPLLQEHQVLLYSREPLEPGLQNLGDHVQARVLNWPPGVLWSHLRLSWELLWHKPDVLFVPANTVPLIHPKKTYTTIHDVAFERFPELYQGRSVQRRLGWLRPFMHLAVRIFTLGRYSASERDYHRWSTRHALLSSQCVFTVSEFSKQEIIDTLGAEPDKIVVTHLGVKQASEVGEYLAKKEVAINQYRLTKPYFIFIGRLEVKKNIGLLLAAYEDYRSTFANPLDLVLIGNPGFGWAEAWAKISVDTQSHIHQLGWVPENDRWALQAGARAIVFLSKYEGFGLPPVESLSLDVPVLSSRAGSLPEVLGSAAVFVESEQPEIVAEAMNRIATDEPQRQQCIAQGRTWVRQYTWSATAKKTAPILLQ